MKALRRTAASAAFVVGLLWVSAAFAQQSQTQTQLPTMAVSAVQVDEVARSSLPPSFSANTLTREIEGALDATRRFTIVSRSRAAAEGRLEEQITTGRGDVAAQRAQYLLTGEVLGMDLQRQTRPVPNLNGKSATSTVGRLELRVELEVNTGSRREIRSRFPIEARVSTPAVVHDSRSPPGEGADSLGFVDLAKAVGHAIADRVRDEIYPVRIIRRQDNLVFLNRGGDSGYTRGERLRVFSADGPRLVDPDTGEDLGPQEVQLGSIEVTEVLPRSTTARVVSEDSPIVSNSIVRR